MMFRLSWSDQYPWTGQQAKTQHVSCTLPHFYILWTCALAHKKTPLPQEDCCVGGGMNAVHASRAHIPLCTSEPTFP